MSALLRADSVRFAYRGGRPVLRGVSFAADRGSLVGILGPNGSGKTTLLKLLAGSLQPSSGTVLLDDRPLVDWRRRELARRIALVPQETQTAFDFTAIEIVLMGRYPHLGAFALEGPDDLATAQTALASTGTADLASRRFATLSGGEKQRVVIAGALAQSADLMLLDEPTGSLDLGHQLDVAELLRRLNADRGVTIVLSTHDLNFAASICRTLILLRDGAIVAQGPTADVLTRDTIRALYDVDAEIVHHARAGRITVTPIARAT